MPQPGPSRPLRYPRLALTALYVTVVVLYAIRAQATPPTPARPAGADAIRELAARADSLDLSGDHDSAEALWALAERLDPNDPRVPIGRVSSLFWRLMYDEQSTRFDAAITRGIAEAIRLAEARLEARPRDLDARAQLGRALMQRARLDGTRGRFLAAGRAGERGRAVLEGVLADAPDRLDARFDLGLYYYFAGALPDLVHWLNWLWFVPAGDRETGLAYLDAVAATPGPRQWDARFVRMSIDHYHTPQDLPRALAGAASLHDAFPRNVILQFELCEVLYQLERYDEVVRLAERFTARDPEDAARRGRVQMIRVWQARAELMLGRTGAATRLLDVVAAERSVLPSWGQPWFHVVRGQVRDVEGRRAAAVADYKRALEQAAPEFEHATALAERGLAEPFRVARAAPERALSGG